ncbi:MAG: hypothetical protein M0C28_29880 [Candidatus Moduliflexus flocculans]|nr:hypothetical protein [Candidatus Moduliflexus flocculans]
MTTATRAEWTSSSPTITTSAETLPNAKAIINPKLLAEGHQLKTLAGVGVAYKLAEALLDGRPQTEDRPPSTVHGLLVYRTA